MLEVLDTRLLSVLVWYHLTFLAISVAMLGIAAGAVLVFVGGPFWSPERVTQWLPRVGVAFALVLTLSHIANLTISFPLMDDTSVIEIVSIGIATLVLTLPFIVSGVVVTLVLTRTNAPVSLGVAAFIDLGVKVPSHHLVLVTADHIATLIDGAATTRNREHRFLTTR